MDSCFGNTSNGKRDGMGFDMEDDSRVFFTGGGFRDDIEEPSRF